MPLSILQINQLVGDQDTIIEGLLAAQELILSTVADIGAVVTRERYLEEAVFVEMFRSLNDDKSPRGVAILWQKMIRQSKGPRVCTVQQRHRFSYEIYHPFSEDLGNGRVSFDDFMQKYQRINNALNNTRGSNLWDLGITAEGTDVEHQFLQGEGDTFVKQFGTGAGSYRAHYITNTLDVLVVVPAHGG